MSKWYYEPNAPRNVAAAAAAKPKAAFNSLQFTFYNNYYLCLKRKNTKNKNKLVEMVNDPNVGR